MRTFNIMRTEDVSGISGTGIVAEGVEFHDGQAAISWFGRYHILEVAVSLDTWLAVHSHDGRTHIEFLGKDK